MNLLKLYYIFSFYISTLSGNQNVGYGVAVLLVRHRWMPCRDVLFTVAKVLTFTELTKCFSLSLRGKSLKPKRGFPNGDNGRQKQRYNDFVRIS